MKSVVLCLAALFAVSSAQFFVTRQYRNADTSCGQLAAASFNNLAADQSSGPCYITGTTSNRKVCSNVATNTITQTNYSTTNCTGASTGTESYDLTGTCNSDTTTYPGFNVNTIASCAAAPILIQGGPAVQIQFFNDATCSNSNGVFSFLSGQCQVLEGVTAGAYIFTLTATGYNYTKYSDANCANFVSQVSFTAQPGVCQNSAAVAGSASIDFAPTVYYISNSTLTSNSTTAGLTTGSFSTNQGATTRVSSGNTNTNTNSGNTSGAVAVAVSMFAVVAAAIAAVL